MLLNADHPKSVMDVSPGNPTAPVSRLSRAEQANALRIEERGTFHYYGIPPPSRIPWVALIMSAGLHAVAILGFNGRAVVKKAVVVQDAPSEMLMMPDLEDPEEKKPVELADDEPITAPAVQVPMLADIPTMVPVNAFTQLIDLTPPIKAEALAGSVIAIPVNIQRGRPDTSKIKDLFNIADLDRRPEPIVQTPPLFPYELKLQVSEARVRLGFIVTSQGDVIMPYVISSSHRGFERPALDAVLKWKFKPGMRGGRKVNTRVEQPIDFKVSDE
jgi:protein TonB